MPVRALALYSQMNDIEFSRSTSLIWETISMPQNGLQFLLMIPTTFPVGFLAASAADILNCSDTQEYNNALNCAQAV